MSLLVATVVWLGWAFVAFAVAFACHVTYRCCKEGRQLLRDRRLRVEGQRRFHEWGRVDEEIARLEALWNLPARPGRVR